MSISPIHFNGMIQSGSEVSHTQSQEVNKSGLQQANFTVAVEKKIEEKSRQVTSKDDPSSKGDSYDREGDGKGYKGLKQNKKKKERLENEADGKVVLKNQPSFDVKI